MKRIALVIALAFALVVTVKASPAIAEGLLSASENASTIAKDKTVNGSAYLAGQTVDVEGTVKGDVYCAGQSVTISGTVEGDVLCAGRTVTVSGIVHGDVRAAGMSVVLKGTVDGSVSLAGSSVTTDSASKVGRDATITAATIGLSGLVSRDAVLAGQEISISGTINRDVHAAGESINAATTAKIGNNLIYRSNNEAALPSGVVLGSVQHVAVESTVQAHTISASEVIMGLIVSIIGFAVLTLLLVIAAPRYVHRVSDISGLQQFGLYLLVGLVTIIVAPVLGIVMLVTIVGIPAAIVLGVAVTLGLLVGSSLVAYRLGRFMLDGRVQPLLSALLGSLALGVLSIIPFVGVIVILVSVSIGFGMVIMGMRSQYAAAQVVVKPKQVTKRSKNPRP